VARLISEDLKERVGEDVPTEHLAEFPRQ